MRVSRCEILQLDVLKVELVLPTGTAPETAADTVMEAKAETETETESKAETETESKAETVETTESVVSVEPKAEAGAEALVASPAAKRKPE
ncbi:hypothetical protein KIPB_000177 [Kipferlia bialata]|uniref:Uncharacterized protein n=1 Tax=Kipferlia bialata TaxID=797122 RepID=A0A9K3CNV7_9EUKA|nr:hypothetical protein KIPB_000177 [Kipferlia bialata]|eukprot:g177.t1